MPATNQRSSPHRRKRPNSSLVHGAGHSPSAHTNRRNHTTKKGDFGRPTSLFTSSASAGAGMPMKRGEGMKKRARGKHRLRPKQGKSDMVR